MKRIVVATVMVALGLGAFAFGRISEDDGGEDRPSAMVCKDGTE